MVGLVSFDLESQPAVRRPVFEIAFGTGDGGGGLVGAVAGAVGVSLGGEDPWRRNLVSLTVETGIAPAVDTVEITLATGADAPSVAIGDQGTIALGYADGDTTPVFAGQVEGIHHRIGGATRIAVGNGAARLARLRVNQSYEQQNSGEIVSDLAGQAGVSTATVEAGIEFPFYVVDDRRSAYAHLAELARKSGYLAYLTPAGELSFAPVAGGEPVQSFSYGVDILGLTINQSTPAMDAITTIGEGAAGSQGQNAWSWLVKDPAQVKGTAGSGEPRLVQDRSLRSSQAAQTAAQGRLARLDRQALTGAVWVPGAPAVTVGSTIAITDAPTDALNGRFLVRAVRHRFTKREGFITRIGFVKQAGGAGLPGGLL